MADCAVCSGLPGRDTCPACGGKGHFGPGYSAPAVELVTALRRLTFAARTSGGVAGRDEGLCAACDEAERVLAKFPSRGQL